MIYNNEYIEPYEEIIGSYTKEFIIEQLNRLDDKSKDLIATKIVELDKSNYYKETYIEILKKQINKAIEYIESNKEKQYSFDYYEYGLYKEEINKLLDILRGEDNDNKTI